MDQVVCCVSSRFPTLSFRMHSFIRTINETELKKIITKNGLIDRIRLFITSSSKGTIGFPAAGTFAARGTSFISSFPGSEMFSLLDWVVKPC